MADYYYGEPISEETFAAWLDGALTVDAEKIFMEECILDPDMQNLLEACDMVDETYEEMVEGGFCLPEELSGDFILPDVPVAADCFHHDFVSSDADAGFDDALADDSDEYSDNVQVDGTYMDSGNADFVACEDTDDMHDADDDACDIGDMDDMSSCII